MMPSLTSARQDASPLLRSSAPAPYSEPARVAPARLPVPAELGWSMVNLGLLTLLLGIVSRLF